MSKLILLVVLIFSNPSVFAEENDVDIFIPDFNLSAYYDYKTYTGVKMGSVIKQI